MSQTLEDELERRHVCVTEKIALSGDTVQLLKPRSADALISEDDFVRDERLPYWADLWPSSRVLAEELGRESGGGASCLELGCGLGLVTIAALRAGYTVTATDYYADALDFTRANAIRAAGRAPATRLVNWRALPDDLGTFDRVVAADVLYEREYGPLVAGVIARVLSPYGVATVADPGRIAAEVFVRAAESLGLRIARAPEHLFEEGAITQRIRLFELHRVAC